MPANLEIEPRELLFPRGTRKPVARQLVVRNTSASPVLFRVRTTARKRYMVKPASATLAPLEKVTVQVVFNPHAGEPEQDAVDKFQIQSVSRVGAVVATADEDVWAAAGGNVKRQRVDVLFGGDEQAAQQGQEDSDDEHVQDTVAAAQVLDASPTEQQQSSTSTLEDRTLYTSCDDATAATLAIAAEEEKGDKVNEKEQVEEAHEKYPAAAPAIKAMGGFTATCKTPACSGIVMQPETQQAVALASEPQPAAAVRECAAAEYAWVTELEKLTERVDWLTDDNKTLVAALAELKASLAMLEQRRTPVDHVQTSSLTLFALFVVGMLTALVVQFFAVGHPLG
eukprot:TRINITY_DN5126_c0_g1_i2.p1 TRINITY_DN5126_c0_g1~~TRINITY_DN5126_c0_g1_i2.p1  ORF type:complete len:340 (-),score=98.16 TRINITY_DN5126_c0_g1_i2:82-1101(-)